jgi:hypothetical protein
MLPVAPANSSSSSSSQGEPSVGACGPVAVRVVDRLSRPLERALIWCEESYQLAILKQGWSPQQHQEDAGLALLHACRTVRLAVVHSGSVAPTAE